MVSFLEVWDNMKRYKEEKDAEHIDTGAMKAIRTGLSVNETFWDDFMQVCNNAEKVADLLGVRVEQVLGWSTRIKQSLEKVQQADANGEGEEKPKTKVMDTGDFSSPSMVGGISTNQVGV